MTKRNRDDNREEDRQRLKEERYMRMCQICILMASRLFPSALQELQTESDVDSKVERGCIIRMKVSSGEGEGKEREILYLLTSH